MTDPIKRGALVDELQRAGFVAADAEADQLIRHGGRSPGRLDTAVRRRLSGEPLAWILGKTTFCGVEVCVDAGVYVPRSQTELLVGRAIGRLPLCGTAVDVCTGSGAIALALAAARPSSRVVAIDIDPVSVGCALNNGVEAYEGDLFDRLPAGLDGAVDVVIGVVPYVPRTALAFLQRDTLTFESLNSYDGGSDGTDLLRRVVADSTGILRRGGALILELGAGQPELLEAELVRAGFGNIVVIVDDDRNVRGIEATLDAR